VSGPEKSGKISTWNSAALFFYGMMESVSKLLDTETISLSTWKEKNSSYVEYFPEGDCKNKVSKAK